MESLGGQEMFHICHNGGILLMGQAHFSQMRMDMRSIDSTKARLVGRAMIAVLVKAGRQQVIDCRCSMRAKTELRHFGGAAFVFFGVISKGHGNSRGIKDNDVSPVFTDNGEAQDGVVVLVMVVLMMVVVRMTRMLQRFTRFNTGRAAAALGALAARR
jgi:hypothetical protein